MVKPCLLIAGLGRTGVEIAHRLCGDWEVIAVDPDAEALEVEELSPCAGRHVGDATSAHVLLSAGAERAEVAVAATEDDEKNLEVLRIARERLGIERRLAILRDHAFAERYQQGGVEVVDRFRACAAVLAARVAGGHKVATEVGLGRGEILEVAVLANSSVIGHRLAELRPRRWLVGAVYRDGELIVPHGDTVLQAEDRVLIIGDPEILPSIATYIGAGEPEFPLHYGSHLTALGARGLEAVLGEARYLIEATAARGLIVHAGPERGDAVRGAAEAAGVRPVDVVAAELPSRAGRAPLVGDDVGLCLLPPEPLTLLQRVGLGRSRTVRIIDQLQAPALICRGSEPYKKVLLVLAELPFAIGAARLAVDLARMLDAELCLGVVHQAELVVGGELRAEIDERRRQVVELAQMYKLSLTVEELTGNPIQRVAERSADYDLVVLPYRRHRRSSLTSPDVGQNLIHRVRCSALVMPCD